MVFQDGTRELCCIWSDIADIWGFHWQCDNMLRYLVRYAFACFLVTLAGKFAICYVRTVYTMDDPQTTSELWDSLQALLAQVYLLRHAD